MSMSTTPMAPTPTTDPGGPRLGRRALFTGGAAGLGIGAALGAGLGAAGALVAQGGIAAPPDSFGLDTVPCHGAHQAGIISAPSAHIRYTAYELRPETDVPSLARMFRILTGDIEGLTAGEAPLADPEPELATRPSRLTVTVGVGSALVDLIAPGMRPSWLAPLPAFDRDQLGQGFDGGDLLIMVQADDLIPVSHAMRVLGRDLAGFAVPLWSQTGFRQSRGSDAEGATMRNLMGQVDGTVNPAPDAPDFDDLVWLGAEAGWLANGSAFVLRRIRMELDTWDRVDRPGREQTIGRRLTDGSPLSAPETHATEHTAADFSATNELGLRAISTAAHIRRAHSTDPNERIFRRAFNYDDRTESGLLFGCYQRDPLQQFVPIQRRLDEADLLNEWVTHTGSAVFAILPGFAAGEMLGQTLLG